MGEQSILYVDGEWIKLFTEQSLTTSAITSAIVRLADLGTDRRKSADGLNLHVKITGGTVDSALCQLMGVRLEPTNVVDTVARWSAVWPAHIAATFRASEQLIAGRSLIGSGKFVITRTGTTDTLLVTLAYRRWVLSN